MTATSEFTFLEEHRRAILAMLDHESARSYLQNLLRGTRDTRLTRQQFGFSVVDQQHVDTFQCLEQVLAMIGIGNPVIHCVAANELYPSVHLAANVALQNRIDVGKKEIVGIKIFGGNLRVEGLKDV